MPPCGGHLCKAQIVEEMKGFKSCPRVGGISRSPLKKSDKEKFQVVPPCGGHPRIHSQRAGSKIVSSRAPVWGASIFWRFLCLIFSFQVVPPCGGHQLRDLTDDLYLWFQVVPPCGGHPKIPTQPPKKRSFKSCPRVGGILKNEKHDIPPSSVSSRAPVWGASFLVEKWKTAMKFQVVPPCGGHRRSPLKKSDKEKFQVVPPCGGHLSRELFESTVIPVSSRAPVWGASSFDVDKKLRDLFQVVPPCGGHL